MLALLVSTAAMLAISARFWWEARREVVKAEKLHDELVALLMDLERFNRGQDRNLVHGAALATIELVYEMVSHERLDIRAVFIERSAVADRIAEATLACEAEEPSICAMVGCTNRVTSDSYRKVERVFADGTVVVSVVCEECADG